MSMNRIAICMNCSIDDDEAYILNNSNPHKKQQRPRLSLRQYGGALTSITETPQLKRSAIFDPTSHRLSSSLTLPSSIQQQHHETSISNSRRRHTVQSIYNSNDATSTIQWYDSDGSTLLVDFPHNQQSSNDDEDQSIDDGHAKPCSSTHELSNTAAICSNINNDNTYDKHGRCIHHPQIQLRRRQLFSFSSEWKTILKVCPDCCMEELNRLYASTGSIKKVNEHGKKEEESGLDETELYDGDSTDDEEEDSSRR